MLSIGFRILTLPLSLLTLLQLALTSPIPERPSQPNFTDRLGYSQFQISDGYGGDAEARAAAVFKEPLAGLNLSELPYDAFDQIAVMREATEDAHREAFVPQIASAPSDRSQWPHALSIYPLNPYRASTGSWTSQKSRAPLYRYGAINGDQARKRCR